ncbi:hypothetical protein D1BOALGB6SA_8087 [Olavius sp. associated proteobacterium Delta 1]|nr:hypothetical protein D1BOALGB6SA_8087 [Olavius sp. associated proteobacterium Delta 1]
MCFLCPKKVLDYFHYPVTIEYFRRYSFDFKKDGVKRHSLRRRINLQSSLFNSPI